MSDKVIKKHGEKFLEKANVIGYAKKLQPKILEKEKKILEDRPCLRVFVKGKVAEKELRASDLIPKEVEGIETDVVDVKGSWVALSAKRKRTKKKFSLDAVSSPTKTEKHTTMIAGISVGNWGITTGTLGWFFEKDHIIRPGSNAHVVADNPSREVSSEKRVVQPGKYDSGTLADYIGAYFWHKQLYPEGGNSDCSIAKGWAAVYNELAELFGARTRLKPIITELNHIDFGVFDLAPNIPYELKTIDMNIENKAFAGLGFAGSEATSLVCKTEYMQAEGYKPAGVDVYGTHLLQEGDILHKTGRTSCYTTAEIMDMSIVSLVDYGSFIAKLDDIILTSLLLKPGDSGSATWYELPA